MFVLNCDPDNFFCTAIAMPMLFGSMNCIQAAVRPDSGSLRLQIFIRVFTIMQPKREFHFKNLISHHSSVYRLKLTKFGFCKVWWPLLERKFFLEILRSHYFHRILFPRKLLKETALYVSSNFLCIYHAKRYRALRGKRWRFRILWDTFTSVNFT